MAKKTKKPVKTKKSDETIYVLKMLLYLILASQWLRITKGAFTLPIPIGFMIGLAFARIDRTAMDRKIEYAILLIIMFISYWLPLGFELVL